MKPIRDLSKYDPNTIAWDEYEAFILRCFDGTDEDDKFRMFRTDVMLRSKPWWPYMFFDFRFPPEPQVPAALKILGAQEGNQVLAIDVEEWYIYKFPPHDVLLAKMKVLHDAYIMMTGLHPMWYFSAVAVIHEHLMPVPSWLLEDPLWVADWRSMTPEYDPWTKWTIHQYRGEPDLNQFNGTREQFYVWLLSQPEPPPPNPLPEFVIVNNIGGTYINIRSEPNPSSDIYIIGRAFNGKKWKPYERVVGTDGNYWWRINQYAYIASWLTKY